MACGNVGDKLSVVGTVEPVKVSALGAVVVVTSGGIEFCHCCGGGGFTRYPIPAPASRAGPPSLITHIAIQRLSSSLRNGDRVLSDEGKCLVDSSEFTSSLHYPSAIFRVVL